MIGFPRLRVVKIDRLCGDAVAITFDVPPELRSAFAFRAGQFLTIRREVHGRDERRSYSICAPQGAAPRIGVRRVEGGLFSQWLVDRVEPGELLDVAPPAGSFSPDLGGPGYHAMLAAGSGITPVLSIVETVLRSDPASQVALLYGNRRSDTVMFAEELAEEKDRHGPRLQLAHVLSREPQTAEIFTGRLNATKLRRLLPAILPVGAVDHWWLCGPYEMITDAQRVLADLAVPDERVHRELFYVDTPPPVPVRPADELPRGRPTSAVTVVLDGRSTTLTLPRDMPVLDAAQRVRADLPFACKGGVCGTCRARVTHGEVRMRRNFALDDRETAAGFVLTCQSLPVGDTVTVDFDS